MRIGGVVTGLFLLCTCVCVAAADDIITNESVHSFISAFPAYKQFIEEIGAGGSLDKTIANAQSSQEKLSALLAQYGLTVPDFALLTQRITIGYSALQLRQNGIAGDPFGLGQMGNALSESELSVIEKNLAKLKPLFEDDSQPE